MKSGLVSVIIPVYNGELYLEESLHSVLEQSYQPVEIIVINDGSSDRTSQILAGFGDSITHIDQTNQGPTIARNRGLATARGEYIAFLDADDLWHTEKLKRQVNHLLDSPELDACVTHVQNFLSPELQGSLDKETSSEKPGYSVVSLLAKQSFFNRIGSFDESMGHAADTDWFLRAKDLDARMRLLPDVLVYRRLHHNNRSNKLAEKSKREYLGLVKASLDRKRARQAEKQ